MLRLVTVLGALLVSTSVASAQGGGSLGAPRPVPGEEAPPPEEAPPEEAPPASPEEEPPGEASPEETPPPTAPPEESPPPEEPTETPPTETPPTEAPPAATPPGGAAPDPGDATPFGGPPADAPEATPPPAQASPPSDAPADLPPFPAGTEALPFPEGPAATAPPPTELQVVVIEAAPYGVDPVVGRHVTQQMRETAASLGYRVVDAEATAEAARRLRMPYPPAPADLWRVTWVAGAERGAFARVWAHQGAYVFELSVASLDGAGPFFARGTSGAEDLHAVVDRLTREALPPPSTYDGAAAQRIARGEASTPAPVRPAVVQPLAIDAERPPRARRSRIPTRRWDVALLTEGAVGTSSDGFYNHIFGMRLGFRITNAVHLGAFAGYANLRGRNGRVGNMLFYAQIEDRVRVSPRTDVTVPLRLGVGYLPFNGPFVRLSAGANIPLTQRFELGFDLLAPTFWVLPGRTAVSLDLSAEIIYRL